MEVSATSADATFDAVGKTVVPSDITGLTYEPISDTMIRLKWNTPTDIDVIKGGKVYVRHSTLTDGNELTNAIDLVKALAGNTNTADVPLEGIYLRHKTIREIFQRAKHQLLLIYQKHNQNLLFLQDAKIRTTQNFKEQKQMLLLMRQQTA